MSSSSSGSPRCHLVTVTRSGQVGVWRLKAGSDKVRLASHWRIPDPEDRVTCVTCLHSGEPPGRREGGSCESALSRAADLT